MPSRGPTKSDKSIKMDKESKESMLLTYLDDDDYHYNYYSCSVKMMNEVKNMNDYNIRWSQNVMYYSL